MDRAKVTVTYRETYRDCCQKLLYATLKKSHQSMDSFKELASLCFCLIKALEKN
jgi:hypothetical protein